MIEPLLRTDLPLPNRREGKVRDLYELTLSDGRETLLLVATDRISAFDVVMPNGIPGKGVVLTQMSRFWFEMVRERFGADLPQHLISTDAGDIPGLNDEQRVKLQGRVMIGQRTRVVPIECVVRGYLAGSGWQAYQQSGTVCGIELPAGLQRAEKLPEPIFTPATKAETGHDENIDFDTAAQIAGHALAAELRRLSLALYQMAHEHAAEQGIILADTKFEFGLPLKGDGGPVLIDEILTPDSSRYWPATEHRVGEEPPSFDKQFVRNYLEQRVAAGAWDKTPPGPVLPPEIVSQTRQKYLEAYERLTGRPLGL